MDTVSLTIKDLLSILQYSTRHIDSLELQKRVASEFVIELRNRGDIDAKAYKNLIIAINPEVQQPEKVTVATRTVPYWWPEEMGNNGLMWRNLR